MTIKRRALYVFIAGFIIDFVGFVLHLIAMATTEWSTLDSDNTAGVYRTCDAGSCSFNSDPETNIQAMMALTLLSIVLIMIAIILALIHIVLEVLEAGPAKLLPLIAGCMSLAAFLFALLGVIVWGADVHADLEDFNSNWEIGYSLPLSMVGGLFMLIGGALLLLGDRFLWSSEKKLLHK